MRKAWWQRQAGQAIVLIAVIMVVLIGFLGLAIDGGRAYLDRRELQAATDAAALAAAHDYMNHSSYDLAERAATTAYGRNERLYEDPSCTGYGTLAVACTYPDATQHVLTITVVDRTVAGVYFTATGNHRIGVALMQVLGIGTTIPVGATATAIARHRGTNGAAIQTLSPSCSTGVSSTSAAFTGSSKTTVVGDVWANGAIVYNGNALGNEVDGNAIDVCPPQPPVPLPPPNWTVTGVETNGLAMADPDYPERAIDPTGRSWDSVQVVQYPGTYSADPRVTGGGTPAPCYFLAPGVYDFAGGLTTNTGLISNELRPPDEPSPTSNTTRGVQFWTGTAGAENCAGSFQPYPVTSDNPVPAQAWGIEVTAVRQDCAGATCVTRESAPSMCRPVDVASGQGIQVWISNVPGAQSYNIYAEPSGNCTGTFGRVQNVLQLGTETSSNTSECGLQFARNLPPTFSRQGWNCTLGSTTAALTGTDLPAGWDPAGAPQPPAGEVASPAGGANMAAPAPGDLANENYCLDTTGDGKCDTTPGAVTFFIPGGGSTSVCLNMQGGGDMYVYSGLQYERVLLYEPGALQMPPPNTCTNNVAGGGLTSLLGIFYVPAAVAVITGSAGYTATIAGGVIAWQVEIKGNGGVAIRADPKMRTWPAIVHLVR